MSMMADKRSNGGRASKTSARTAQKPAHPGGPPAKPPIVGIGASAGGIKALQSLFEHLPDKLGLAYVVILHPAPEIRSELPSILSARTDMPVTTVEGPTSLEPDHVYVISPDRTLSIKDHQIASEPFDEPRGKRETVRRLAEELRLTQARLRTTREETEGANEELRAANEELQSINEEYRSTSEKLETSKEELQTVNNELKLKLEGVTFVGITERLRIEQALRESEERLRQEMRLVDLSHSPIFVWDFDGGVVQWNRGSEQLYGYPRNYVLGLRKNVLLKTEVPGSSFEALTEKLLKDGRWTGELVQTTRDGRRLTVESELELVAMGGRRLVMESTHDVTERKIWEKRQELMVAELSHRGKNTLAVVQSIATRSIRGAHSAEEFIERFEGRLMALSKAQRLLVDPWKGADVGAMVREQLEPYAVNTDRMRIEGDPINLPPDTATPLGLILHELATNATKYGAWSDAKGVVELSWRRLRHNGTPHIGLIWRERGGPKVKPPEHTGFGSQLIQHGAPNSNVDLEFNPNGLVCTIELQLPEETLNDLGGLTDSVQ